LKTLFIARHGEAVSVGAPGVYSDFDRHLSEEGEQKIKKQAESLLKLGATWQKVLCSPLVRARQTAELLNSPQAAPLEIFEALGDRPSFSEVRKKIEASHEERILLVTHQPFVVELTSYLLTGEMKTAFHFSTGAMACLRIYQLSESPRGELEWFKPSSSLQAFI